MIIHGYGNYKIGDILVFWSNKNYPIIHRIISTTETPIGTLYNTKGDHNAQPINNNQVSEYNIPENKIVGKAIFRVPYLGWVKIIAVKLYYAIISTF